MPWAMTSMATVLKHLIQTATFMKYQFREEVSAPRTPYSTADILYPRRSYTSRLPIDTGRHQFLNLNGHIEHIAIFNGSIFRPNIFSQRQQSSSHSQANRWIGDDHIIHPASFNDSAIVDLRIALPVASPLHFEDESNVTGRNVTETFHPFHGNLGLGLGWEPSQHVSGSTFMTGVSLPTNGFQFANARDLGHLLSYPMQTQEAAFMQGLLDGSNAWDGAGLTNALHITGKSLLRSSCPTLSTRQQCFLAVTSLATKHSRRGTGLATSKAFISRVEDITCVPLLSAARATELDTVDHTR